MEKFTWGIETKELCRLCLLILLNHNSIGFFLSQNYFHFHHGLNWTWYEFLTTQPFNQTNDQDISCFDLPNHAFKKMFYGDELSHITITITLKLIHNNAYCVLSPTLQHPEKKPRVCKSLRCQDDYVRILVYLQKKHWPLCHHSFQSQ